ncbi:hypothetical protein ACUUL3_08450 [Thiovibrio sp. JS02]
MFFSSAKRILKAKAQGAKKRVLFAELGEIPRIAVGTKHFSANPLTIESRVGIVKPKGAAR